MDRNDSHKKKMTSLRSPSWRRLMDVVFVSLLLLCPFPSAISTTPGSRRQAGRLCKRVCVRLFIYLDPVDRQ